MITAKTVSIEEFGGVADGITDNTQALQALQALCVASVGSGSLRGGIAGTTPTEEGVVGELSGANAPE